MRRSLRIDGIPLHIVAESESLNTNPSLSHFLERTRQQRSKRERSGLLSKLYYSEATETYFSMESSFSIFGFHWAGIGKGAALQV